MAHYKILKKYIYRYNNKEDHKYILTSKFYSDNEPYISLSLT